MVSAHNFSEWKDFPKGLHVMVVDKDNALLSHLKSKLEALDYTVTTFSNEDDAMAALHTHSYHFHVILAEAPVDAGVDNFKVLQSAQNVPIIMMSDTENMAVMIQSIALGASDFLQKPIADEKLKIIWHHVARKAMSTGKVRLPVSSIDVHQSEEKQDVSPTKYLPSLTEAEEENRKESILIAPCEIFFAQGTSQLEQKRRIILPLDSCRDSSRSDDICCVKIEVDDIEDTFTLSDSSEKVKTEACGTLDKSSYSCSDVSGHDRFQQSEFNCVFQLDDNLDDLILFSDLIIGNDEMSIDYLHEKLDWNEVDEAEEEALLLAEVAKAEKERFLITESNPDKEQQKKADISRDCIRKMSKICGAGRRKMKVEWTPELHRRFVEAVEQLGVEKAIPSKILELMGVQCLTRHNIASHLQKYRSHRKHLSVREAEGMNWNNRRNLDATIAARARREGSNLCLSSSHRNTPPIQPRPCPGFMPVQIGPPLHVWGHPTLESMHRWQKSYVTAAAAAAAAWQAPDGTFWQHPATFTDAWIHPTPVPGTPCYPYPIMRLPLAPIPEVVDMAVPTTLGDYVHGNMTAILFEAEAGKNTNFQQPKETVDVAITEVLKDPWTPLPLGLKPPSLDSVMLELQKQGLAVVATDLPSSAT